MAISARPASSLPAPAKARPVPAGTYTAEVGDDVVTGWHSHDLHQLEYAFEGVVRVETETARYLLPPQQALWIPAGVEHCSTLTNVKSVSVFFDPATPFPATDRVRILAAAPVIREMVLYAKRWPIGRAWTDPVADTFFEALAHLVGEWLDHETPLCLPTSRDPLVAAAMDYTAEHLSDVCLSELCAAIGTSERSLRRAFLLATGMPWRQYLLESRLLSAMALLADSSQNVLSIGVSVGFRSASAFTRAFERYTGETPTAYRRRIRNAHAASADAWATSVDAHSIRRWSHW